MKEKSTKARDIKKKVSVTTINRLAKATLGYGNLSKFADKVGVHRDTIRMIRQSGIATSETLKKVESVLRTFKPAA